ncbi:MAG: T9SS type A sorting domain-containing protein [Flavobacteriales bacterium]|nr:T9SS type A sorting domain-containing protein [Flavobacteriales bacterium]
MRHLFLTLFAVVSFLFNGMAQQAITITHNDMPNVNDTFRLSICDNLLGIVNLNDDGPDQTWNYSTLGSFNQRVDEFVDPVLGTPLIYNVTFSNFFDMNYFATLAAPDQFGQFGANLLNVTEVYDFYRETNSYFDNVGLGLTINGFPLTAKMNPRDKIYEFPLEYGDQDNSFAQFGVSVPSFGYYGQKIWRSNTVDAWGELTTRYGTFNTLRVTTILDVTDTISFQGLNFEQAQPTSFEVKWFAKNIGIPVLTAKGQILFGQRVVNSIEYLDSIRGFTLASLPPNPVDTTTVDTTTTDTTGTSGIWDFPSALHDLRVAPNPFNGELIVFIDADKNATVNLSLWDLLGRCISTNLTPSNTVSAGQNMLWVNTEGIKPGTYQLIITEKSGQRHALRVLKL